MITQEQTNYQRIFSTIAGIMLLLAIPSIWPYGYFQFLRWVVMGAAGFNAYIASQLNKTKWLWTMVIMAILFNPIVPTHLSKGTWAFLDLVAALLILISIKKIK